MEVEEAVKAIRLTAEEIGCKIKVRLCRGGLVDDPEQHLRIRIGDKVIDVDDVVENEVDLRKVHLGINEMIKIHYQSQGWRITPVPFSGMWQWSKEGEESFLDYVGNIPKYV